MNPFQDLGHVNSNANASVNANPNLHFLTMTTNNNNSVAANVTIVKPKTPRSLSRIQGMTVGDVRQCFSQMRDMPSLTSNTTLWCGMTAGNFAFQYLVNTAGSSRRKSGTTSVNADRAGL